MVSKVPRDSVEPIIYVVNNDEAVREAFRRLIQSVNLDVRIFDSAQAFLDYPVEERPACLLLDVRMPRMSGLELQRILKQRDLDVPVIFVTEHADVTAGVCAMKEGALDFLVRPISDDHLIDRIHHALKQHRRRLARRAVRLVLQRRIDSLTPREREVLRLVVTGLANKQIGFELGLAEATVKQHRAQIMGKMRAKSLAHLVRMALHVGLGEDLPLS